MLNCDLVYTNLSVTCVCQLMLTRAQRGADENVCCNTDCVTDT